MKKYAFIAFFLLMAGLSPAFSQTFYVTPTEGSTEKPIIDKLLQEKYHVTFRKDSSDYTLTCMIAKKRIGKATGYVALIDTKTGQLLGKTKSLKGYSYLMNGFSNPKMRISHRIAKKYLVRLIKKYIKK